MASVDVRKFHLRVTGAVHAATANSAMIVMATRILVGKKGLRGEIQDWTLNVLKLPESPRGSRATLLSLEKSLHFGGRSSGLHSSIKLLGLFFNTNKETDQQSRHKRLTI